MQRPGPIVALALAALWVVGLPAEARTGVPRETTSLVPPAVDPPKPDASGRVTLLAGPWRWRAKIRLDGLAPRADHVVRTAAGASRLAGGTTGRRGTLTLRLRGDRTPPGGPVPNEGDAVEVVEGEAGPVVLAGAMPRISPPWIDPGGGTSGGGGGGTGGGGGGTTTTRLAGVDAAGPYAVESATFSLPTAPGGLAPNSTVVWYPGGGGVVSSAAAPYPPVVLVHAFQLSASNYSTSAQMLASWGFVVLVGGHSDPLLSADHEKELATTVGYVDWLAAQNADARSRFSGKLDLSRTGLLGHSLGGGVALVAGTRAAAAGRVKACAGLAPALLQNASGSAILPDTTYRPATLVVTGSQDRIVAPADSRNRYFVSAATPKGFLRLDGLCHMNFADTVGFPASLGSDYDSNTCVQPAEQARRTRLYVVPWFLYHLRGDTRVLDYVDGTYAAQDATAAERSFAR